MSFDRDPKRGAPGFEHNSLGNNAMSHIHLTPIVDSLLRNSFVLISYARYKSTGNGIVRLLRLML